MEYTTLGRTGLRVSVAGLGCGGFSRLGLGTGQSEDHAVRLVREAIERGVTLIDTAAAYGTEEVVGRALRDLRRDSIVLCTKASRPFNARAVTASLDASLTRLGVDYVDVFQVHAVPPSDYAHMREEIVPALLKARDAGKLRYIGITETAPNDPGQEMLHRAAQDEVWDTVMVAFHMMHQVARTQVFPFTQANRIGTLLMFVVRSIFARPAQLTAAFKNLAAEGAIPAWHGDAEAPLDFLIRPDCADSLTDAAYRYARHEPGVDVVLFGTGDAEHLRSNIASILRPPLPQADRERLAAFFSHLQGVGLDVPPPRAR